MVQLRQTRPFVTNVSCVASTQFTVIHQRLILAVVTDDCHANSILVSHVTVH